MLDMLNPTGIYKILYLSIRQLSCRINQEIYKKKNRLTIQLWVLVMRKSSFLMNPSDG